MFELRDASSLGLATSKNSLVLGEALYNDQFLRTRPNFLLAAFFSPSFRSANLARRRFSWRGDVWRNESTALVTASTH
jgi:hypothetical protein